MRWPSTKTPLALLQILDPPLPIFPENVSVSAADPAVWNAEGTFRMAADGKALGETGNRSVGKGNAQHAGRFIDHDDNRFIGLSYISQGS